MSVSASSLGGRLPLTDPAALDGAQKALYDGMSAAMVPWAETAGFESRTEDGRFIGPFNALLLSPAIGNAFLKLQKVEQENTALTERVRQVVILTVGSIWKAPYELYAHRAVARQAGFSDGAARALAAGQTADELDEAECLAQRFTRQLTIDRQVDDALYKDVVSAFGEKGLFDMVVLAGCYQVVCAVLNTFAVPAPAPSNQDQGQ